jgi:hypothetical protein
MARFLRYQSKPRFARNQNRASFAIKAALREQSKARFAQSKPRCARVIKGALRAAVNYSKYFFRVSRIINIFALRAR